MLWGCVGIKVALRLDQSSLSVRATFSCVFCTCAVQNCVLCTSWGVLCICANNHFIYCGFGLQEVCGVAMKVLRVNKDSLMNVLETFLHDPLVEWIKKQDEVKHHCCTKNTQIAVDMLGAWD